MSWGDLYALYKAWKDARKGIHAVTGSGSYKVLQISFKVDRLITDYAEWKKKGSDKDTLAPLRARLRQIKEELTKLMNEAAGIPSFGPDMTMEYAKDLLEKANTAKMARNEWTRVSVEQVSENLPDDDDLVSWPSTRARFINARDTWARASVGYTSQAVRLNTQIDDAQRQESHIRDVRNDPAVVNDPAQIAQLEQDYKEWLGYETDLKTQQGRLQAMAQGAQRMAEIFDQKVQIGDAIYHERMRRKSADD